MEGHAGDTGKGKIAGRSLRFEVSAGKDSPSTGRIAALLTILRFRGVLKRLFVLIGVTIL